MPLRSEEALRRAADLTLFQQPEVIPAVVGSADVAVEIELFAGAFVKKNVQNHEHKRDTLRLALRAQGV
jgi:hypothetical protein